MPGGDAHREVRELLACRDRLRRARVSGHRAETALLEQRLAARLLSASDFARDAVALAAAMEGDEGLLRAVRLAEARRSRDEQGAKRAKRVIEILFGDRGP